MVVVRGQEGFVNRVLSCLHYVVVTHLVWHTQVLLPPLYSMAKGKKVMFVFILEVLDRDGPKPGSFWEVQKKCHCHPHLLKHVL